MESEHLEGSGLQPEMPDVSELRRRSALARVTKLPRFPVAQGLPLSDHPDAFAVVKHGFPIVPSVKGCDEFAGPPAGHPERCQAKKQGKKLAQCDTWQIEGQIFCSRHSGRRLNMGLYDNLFSDEMKAAIEAQQNAPPHERLSTSDELNLMRVASEHAIKMYDAARKLDVSDPENAALVLEASEYLKTSMERVAEVAMKSAKIHAFAQENFSVDQLMWVLMRVSKILEKHLADSDPTALRLITADLKEIRLPPKTSGKLGAVQQIAADVRQAVKEMESPFG